MNGVRPWGCGEAPGLSEAPTTASGQPGAVQATPAPRVRLHPNAADIYRAKVADLEASLNAPEIRLEAAEALRSLISRIVLAPDACGIRAKADSYSDARRTLIPTEAGQ